MPEATKSSNTKKVSEETIARIRSSELDEIADILPHLYFKLAEAYVAGGGEIDDYIIEDYLPDRLFETAKLCNWISNPTYSMSNTLSPRAVFDEAVGGWRDPDKSHIGKWCVSKAFEIEFFKLLEPALSTIRKMVADSEGVEKYHHPNPAERVQMFLKDVGWKKARLIESLADKLDAYAAERKAAKKEKRTKYGDPLQAAKKQLKAITDEPISPNSLKHYHALLCDVMQQHSDDMRVHSQDYASLRPVDLLWR